MRSWMRAMTSFGSTVMMAKVRSHCWVSGLSQLSQIPAAAKRAPSRREMMWRRPRVAPPGFFFGTTPSQAVGPISW